MINKAINDIAYKLLPIYNANVWKMLTNDIGNIGYL